MVRLVAAVVAAQLGAAAPSVAQDPAFDRQVTVTPASSPVTWHGTQATGANVNYDADAGEPCGKTPADYCDLTLVRVDVPADYWENTSGGVQFALSG